jgi:hypothetical protein
MKDAYNHRLRLVDSAKQRGIKPTARLFATTVPTVRKWWRRCRQQGHSGPLPLSRARHHQSQKTSPATGAQLIELRKTLPTFGSRRLIREFVLPVSHCALERIWREQGLLKKRRRKYQRKQDLAHIKRAGLCSNKSAPTLRISTTSRDTGNRPSASACQPFNTPRARCAAPCCSGPSPRIAALPPARF